MAVRADAPPPSYGPAVEDGIAAVRFVRAHASEFGVDPRRVGMIGFSAGAMNTLAVTLANQSNARPDFIGLIYGPMFPVSAPTDAPPAFVALAADDPLFGRGGFGIVDSWRQAQRPVELHLYQAGGHGFGISGHGTSATMAGRVRGWLAPIACSKRASDKRWRQTDRSSHRIMRNGSAGRPPYALAGLAASVGADRRSRPSTALIGLPAGFQWGAATASHRVEQQMWKRSVAAGIPAERVRRAVRRCSEQPSCGLRIRSRAVAGPQHLPLLARVGEDRTCPE